MASLDQVIALRALLRDARTESGVTAGTVTVDPRVGELVDALTDTGLTVRRDGRITTPAALRQGETVAVSFDSAAHNFYERFEDFLKHFPTAEPVRRFHIHDLGFTSDAPVVPEPFQWYRQAVRLWKLLESLADHSDGRRLYLLSSDKLEIDGAYVREDLCALPKLERLEADFATGAASREQMRTLLKRALHEDLGKCVPERRFGCLLRNFGSIYDRYWQNFRLFLEGISFDKIFEGYVEKHAKLITEFNSVLGGIQTALIGLPIASFVILEKMTVANHPTFKNTLLLVGCLVFVAFLGVLSISQGRTLGASKALSKELDDEITGKNPDLARKLSPSLQRLKRHALWVTRLLVTVRFLLAGLAAVTVLTYTYVSFMVFRNWLNAILQSLG